MASTLAPPVDGEDFRASEPTRHLRLGDAERIAAGRLDAAEAAPDAPPAVIERGMAPQASTLEHSSGRPDGEEAEPLASALHAAARLTADANAAAEALESLQRLLQRQLPGIAVKPMPAAPRADAAGRPTWVLPTAPPPLAETQVDSGGDTGSLSERNPPSPALDPSRHIPTERRRFDIRGFLAGFALSWAFGVVLYLFMTAG